MKLLNSFFKKKEVVNRWGVAFPLSQIYDNHHRINNILANLYVDIEDLDDDAFNEIYKRFSKKYSLFIKLPKWVNAYNTDNALFIETMQKVKGLVGNYPEIKGVVLELRMYYGNESECLYSLKNVLVKRLATTLVREGKSLFLVNGEVPNGASNAFSLSNMISIKKDIPDVKLGLNLQNAYWTGNRVLDVFIKENTLAGFPVNFDMVILGGVNDKLGNVAFASEEDKYTIEQYTSVLKQFKKALFIYDCAIEEVLTVHDIIKKVDGTS
jgi:hypothetical protein